MRQIDTIVIHHTASPTTTTVGDIRRWHTAPVSQGGRGWSDIGYHYVIDAAGAVHLGRSEGQVGAHAKGHNASSIGVAFIGHLGEAPPTEPQLAAGVRLVADLLRRYPESRVVGHGALVATECPGSDHLPGELWRSAVQLIASSTGARLPDVLEGQGRHRVVLAACGVDC